MGWIILLILVLAVCWMTFGRNVYINLTRREQAYVELTQPMERESLMDLLRTKVCYPDAKEIFYDENGEIVVECKHAKHTVRCDDQGIYVVKDWPSLNPPNSVLGRMFFFLLCLRTESDTFMAKALEEADCLQAYIQKAINPDAPINATVPKQAMDRHYNLRRWIILGLIGALVAVFITVLVNNGIIGDESKGIKDSYLSEYSETETIGEAFENFFDDTSWKSYKDGALQLVDFKGECLWLDERVTVIFTFVVEDDEFHISELKMNGEPMPDIFVLGLLEAIYSE